MLLGPCSVDRIGSIQVARQGWQCYAAASYKLGCCILLVAGAQRMGWKHKNLAGLQGSWPPTRGWATSIYQITEPMMAS